MNTLLACAVCIGNTDPGVMWVMGGMLAFPFLLVSGMVMLLYWKGFLRTRSAPPGTNPEDGGDPLSGST